VTDDRLFVMSVFEIASFPGHDGGLSVPVPSQTVATWPAGHFVENVAVAADGAVFVSILSHHRIDRYQPETGELDVFCELPAPAIGLAFDPAGTLWVTGGEVGNPPGYIWRVDPDGRWDEWLQIPDALFLNGCAVMPGQQTLLVCESMTGRVLAVDQQNAGWSNWLQGDQLRSNHDDMPGANGIKLNGDTVWISVTDKNTILRVELRPDGSAGQVIQMAEDLRADDFAFGESGALYIATHVVQTVLRLAGDGTRTTIAGPREGAVGSTACAFGRQARDGQALYITTNGGLSFPYEGRLEEAKLLRLDVAEPGRSLLGR
jgi:sugar lactone lactonase YvrE